MGELIGSGARDWGAAHVHLQAANRAGRATVHREW